MSHLTSALLSVGVAAALAGCTPSPPPASTNGSGAFATGKYRILFVEAGHSPQEVTEWINAAFRQLFHGDSRTQAVYYYSVKYICWGGNNRRMAGVQKEKRVLPPGSAPWSRG
jgi:hypothetical protein